MKQLVLIVLMAFSFTAIHAQADPVSWNFSSKKISDKVLEIYMTATVKSGWHIYSQTQPKDAIAQPTGIVFTKNALMAFDGKVKETGRLEKVKDAALGATNYQYSGSVKFVQKITLKAPVKTAVAGTVEYQTCNDKMCLPPKKVPFKINVG